MKILLKAIILVGLLIVLLKSCSPFQGGPNPLVGQQAPDFTLLTLSGQEQNMTQFRNDQPAVIFFWATWCPHCRKQLKELAQQRDDIEQRGIMIILVDVGESLQDVRNYIQAHRIPFDIFLDEDAVVAEEYHLIGVPTFFLLNRNGIIVEVQHVLPDSYEGLLLDPAP